MLKQASTISCTNCRSVTAHSSSICILRSRRKLLKLRSCDAPRGHHHERTGRQGRQENRPGGHGDDGAKKEGRKTGTEAKAREDNANHGRERDIENRISKVASLGRSDELDRAHAAPSQRAGPLRQNQPDKMGAMCEREMQMRYCGEETEIVDYITAECEIHNFKYHMHHPAQVAQVICNVICETYVKITHAASHFDKRRPKSLENFPSDEELHGDTWWRITRKLPHKKPDTVWTRASTVLIIEIGCPCDKRVLETEHERRREYMPPLRELGKMYMRRQVTVRVVPIVIGNTRVIRADVSKVARSEGAKSAALAEKSRNN